MKKFRIYNEYDLVVSMLMITFGLMLIFVPIGSLLSFLFVILGIIILVVNLPSCIYYMMLVETDSKAMPYAIMSLASCIIGSCLIFYHGAVFTYIVAIILIGLPIFRLVVNRSIIKEQIKKELPLLIIGVLLLFTPFGNILAVIVKVIGGLFVAYGIFYLIMAIISIKNNNNNHFNGGNYHKDYIDVDVKEV